MKRIVLSISILVFILNSCKKEDSPSDLFLSQEKQTQVLNNYADILEAGYEDSYYAALQLQSKINAFVTNPSEEGFNAAKAAWVAAREPYMQTEVARFYGGPIDDSDGDPMLNSWPLDEGYIDYLVADAHGTTPYSFPNYNIGIINMPENFPEITKDVLLQNNQPDGGTTNGNGDEVDVSMGYHAIEFLLWGQDDSPASQKIAGQRPYTDYVTGAGGTAQNQARRAQYLKVVTGIVVDNLKRLVDAWVPGQNNYRKNFVAQAQPGIANIFNGIGRLAKGELAAQRMGTPLALHTQEQEHSCFSDNTHRDLWLDMQGIVNVYYGTYTRIDGTEIKGLGLSDFVKATNPGDDAKMKSLLASAQESLQKIEDNKPFDYLIDGSNPQGNAIVQEAINAVSAVSDYISQIARDLKLTGVNVNG